MRETLRDVLELAKARGAGYADIRVVETHAEPITMRNGNVERIATRTGHGVGLRVLVDGAWGFASPNGLTRESLAEAVDLAVRVGRASARWKHGTGVELAPEPPHEDRWENHVAKDPFEVRVEDKVELLTAASRAMAEVPEVKVTGAEVEAWETKQVFVSTEGSFIEQRKVECGAGVMAVARDGHDVQRRSFDDYESRGWEFVEGLDLVARAGRLAREASDLLRADVCPRGRTTYVAGGAMMALQIHESVGHPIELDRVLGTEATFAGTSFLAPEERGRFQYGSPEVNLTADATIEGGLGSFGYDDEGVPAQRSVIVEKGRFENFLMSRETATMFGVRSNGAMRAVGAHNLPLIRMTNVNLEPGDWTFEEIIRDTKEGVFVETPKSWSLDDKRVNFHFGQEVAWEIKDGALGRMLKNPAHTALTPEFWGSMDAVAGRGKGEWKVHGTPGCAKGEPVQVIHVAHGAAPARFRNIKVGVGQ